MFLIDDLFESLFDGIIGGAMNSMSMAEQYQYNLQTMAQQQQYNRENMLSQYSYATDLMRNQNDINVSNLRNVGVYSRMASQQQGIASARAGGGTVQPIGVSAPSGPSGGSPSGGSPQSQLASMISAISQISSNEANANQANAMAEVVRALSPYQQSNLEASTENTKADTARKIAEAENILNNTEYVKEMIVNQQNVNSWYDELTGSQVKNLLSNSAKLDAETENEEAETYIMLQKLPSELKAIQAKAYADHQSGKLSAAEVKQVSANIKLIQSNCRKIANECALLKKEGIVKDKEALLLVEEIREATATANVAKIAQSVENVKNNIELNKSKTWKQIISYTSDVTSTLGKLLGGNATATFTHGSKVKK